MAVNKETLQIEVLSNIDKVLKGLNDSSNYIKSMSNGAVKVDEKFDQLQTSLKEINTILKQIGSGTIFDQLLGAQTRLNSAQKRTVEQYKAIDAAQRYSRATDLKGLDDEKLKYTLKGQTLKLIAAERGMIDNNNHAARQAVEFERSKLTALDREIERRKALEQSQRKSERDAEIAAKKAIVDSEKLARQQEAAAKKAQALAQKATTPYNSATDVARMNAKTSDPNYMNAQRNMRLQSALGDGGAGLFKIQAGLLANYTLMNTFFSTLSFAKEFVTQLDNSLHDLQAITATTTGNMEGLRQKIIEVSEGTKFTAVEVANAAKILGQAGFSTKQIEDSISGVTLLATATGSTLEEAADTASSVISVFQLRAEDMTHVSNVMTEAINKSKLSMDKLALGLQYAGNIAAESGLTFEETTAILAAMSNAGIKSGSTLGTGLRQVLIEMQNPTEKFKKNLADVGLTMQDVDVRSNGFVGVMKKLRDSGFDTAKAFESFEVRSAAAFAAIQNNPDLINELAESFIYSNAAVEANEVQMKSLANITAVLKGNFGLLIDDIAGPIVSTLKVLFTTLSELISLLRQYPNVVAALGTSMTTLAVAFAGGRILNLVLNLGKGLMGLNTAMVAVNATASLTATGGLLSLGRVVLGFLGPIGVAAAILATVAGAISYFSDNQDDLISSIEKSKTSVQNLNGEYEKTGESLNSVGDTLGRLTDRFVALKDNPEEVRLEAIKMERQFSELGLTLKNGTSSSIYELIEALQKLRQELSGTAADQLKASMAESAVLFRQQAQLAKNKITGSNNNYDYFDTFTSGRGRQAVMADPLFQQGRALRSETANTEGNLTSVDLYNADTSQLNSIKNTLNALQVKQLKYRKTLSEGINKLDLLGDKRTDEEEALLTAYIKASQAITDDIAAVNTSLGSVSTAASEKIQDAANELKASDVTAALEERITQFRIDINEIKENVNGGTDEEKAKAVKELQEKIQDLRDQLVELAGATMLNDMEYFQMNLIDELALDGLVDDSVGPAAAAASSNAGDAVSRIKTELSDSAKKSSAAFNTAMQMAKDGFDVIKESYDDIGRKFDARIKSYQDIVDANSNSYSGTFGQYTDAEIENLKKKQYQEKINATRARLDELPNVISNLDGVIGKQSKQPIALDENGNAIRNSVQGNKQLNDLIKKKNTLVAEQNALQSEYNAMMGLTTAEHMTFGEQIKATIQDYAKVQTAQSSWASDIKANLTGAFDTAKSSFADMVYGFVSGSQTAGDAVRSFAKGVLESMLKIATNKLAEGLFGAALGAIGGAIGGNMSYGSAIGPTQSASATGWFGLARGGFVNMAGGGANPNRDSVPTMLRPGEFVMRNQAVEAIGRGNLETINALGARTISNSGDMAAGAANNNSGGTTMMNVYVISPDQKPSLTKNDVIVTIADDLNRGGTIKKLIKSVVLN